MFDNLKIAVNRQKKLLAIFLLTIFLPSITLSIFGIRSIRNERFRLTQQLEDEHIKTATYLKNQIDSRFNEIEITLQNLVKYPSFGKKDYASIEEFLNNQYKDDQLIEHVFLVYKDEEPLFPLFLPVSPKRATIAISSQNSGQRESLERAQRLEFSQKNFSEAAVLYKQVFSNAKNRDIQARMLNNIARCYKKLGNYYQAIQNYSRICQDYPESTTSSSLSLDLVARVQIFRCCKSAGNYEEFLKNSLSLYRNLLQRQNNLKADQFSVYSSMVEKDISDYLSDHLEGFEGEDYRQEFVVLKDLHQKINKEWQVVIHLKNSILPELQQKFNQQDTIPFNPIRHSKIIDQKDYLIITAAFPQEEAEDVFGLLGIKVDEDFLLNHEVNSILEDFLYSQESFLSISTLSGRIVSEHGDSSAKFPSITSYFDENFPPWKVDFFSSGTESSDVMNIRSSYYFWTILTVLVLLSFGTVLVIRTITHEMEVLRLKSDFVSSISHEFKTPITSIKVLIERLRQGKVTSSYKKKEYYSIISEDADKLGSMVRNILDFSKVEEGRKEYVFQESDVAQLVKDEIENFKKVKISPGIRIDLQIFPDIPRIHVDRESFSLALNNLMENAFKFSLERKEILVEVKREAENVRVNVKDKGMGIPSGEMDKIFDKFFQGKNTIQQSIKGTGLGLALVKHTVEAHAGKILLESKVGQGSTFSLVFPVRNKGSRP
jgi:signal transduction histidine kinase/tetratricopeptide (TPR) repeat protein